MLSNVFLIILLKTIVSFASSLLLLLKLLESLSESDVLGELSVEDNGEVGDNGDDNGDKGDDNGDNGDDGGDGDNGDDGGDGDDGDDGGDGDNGDNGGDGDDELLVLLHHDDFGVLGLLGESQLVGDFGLFTPEFFKTRSLVEVFNNNLLISIGNVSINSTRYIRGLG